MQIADVMALAPVIPVIVIDDVAQALPLAEALVAGGLPALEVTLRTPAAIEAIRIMAKVPGAVVGAGTVLNADDMARAIDAGARFAVSPGLTDTLARTAIDLGLPFLPGTASASDIMRGLDHGLTHFKFFPAVAAGGIPALSAILGPLAPISICPTGGISQATAPDWLKIRQVKCVGGSWMVKGGVADPDAIRAAASLPRG
jgi:2-dehydro-3-deoxyphosphogluconate aldolase/(4S)-4-hydroxy-2-oxoglutarate aldolase